MRGMLLALALTVASVGAAQAPPHSHLKVGDKAPDFALPNGDGKLVTLSEFTVRGTVVVILYRGFW